MNVRKKYIPESKVPPFFFQKQHNRIIKKNYYTLHFHPRSIPSHINEDVLALYAAEANLQTHNSYRIKEHCICVFFLSFKPYVSISFPYFPSQKSPISLHHSLHLAFYPILC